MSLSDLKKERDDNLEILTKLEKDSHTSPYCFNQYLNASMKDIKLKCRIEAVERENQRYGQQSRYAIYGYMGTIRTPEGKSVGLK